VSDQAISTPPGWYADPHGTATWRWWDGAAWSDHVSEHAGGIVRPKLPSEVKVNTVWSWAFAALPLFSLVTLVLMDFVKYEPPASGVQFGVFGEEALISFAFTSGVWAAAIFFAYRDYRVLRRAGVVRPFHWAWAFFAWIVYVIGRAVIVGKVSSQWKGPFWAVVVVSVAMLITTVAWVAVGIAGVAS
jgi:hypothetical protein